jgi:ParB family transcriptional regulator, chromosome partitioning protein
MTAMSTTIKIAETTNPQAGFVLIPLNKLAISERNIRRTDRKADLEALAASIKSLGLLQNLSVTRAEGDRLTVVAGGRRLAALKALAKQGALAKDFPVPCHILDDVDALESSLAENVQRVATDAMDEVDAFAALKDKGFDTVAIAQRFGCTIRHVDQRLALAALSPKLKAAYRKGDLSLDAARAFCIEPDPVRQEAVYKMLGKPVTHAGNVRAHLTHGRMRGTDRLARFVGLDSYEAAGGSLTRDLFLDSEIYVDDPALLSRLANEKLEAFREDLLAKGWGWVNVNLGHGRFEGASGQRVQPTHRQPTEDEAASLAKLEADIEELETVLEDADDEDPRWAERDRLDAAHHSLTEKLTSWDPQEMALAGVVVSVEHDGRLFFAHGVVAKADASKLTKLRRQRDEVTAKRLRSKPDNTATNGEAPNTDEPATDGDAFGDLNEAPWEEPRATLPRALVRDLTAIRTTAIRRELVKAPHTALALGVFALLRHAVSGYGAPGFSLTARPRWLADHDGLADEREAWIASIPATEAELLDWCLAQHVATLLDAFALSVASNIDLAHEDANIDDRRKQALADHIASAIDLDMTRHWAPDLAFWTRLPKAALIAAIETAPCTTRLGDVDRASFLKMLSRKTKDELATTAAQVLEGTGWLPTLFVTPQVESHYELTDAGVAALHDAE